MLFCPFDILAYNLNPLIFGISFFLVHRKMLKFKLVIGLLLSILMSYVAFFIGLFGLFGIAKVADIIIEFLKLKSIDGNVYIVFSGLLASLTLYLLYTKIYVIQKIKNGFLIMLFSYLLVRISIYLFPIVFKNILISDFFGTYNLVWIVIVSFFLSFSFNQYKVAEKVNEKI